MALVTLSKDYEFYRSGVYTIINNVWNKGARVNGVDYTQSVTFDTANVTSGVRFDWNWPTTNNVLAYPEIVAGHKPWGDASDQSMTSRVDQLKNFTVDYDLSIGGATADYNVAFEFWLQTRPAGSANDITTEVMVWVHNGRLVAPGDTGIDYRLGGYSASVSKSDDFGTLPDGTKWDYIALAADRDTLKGTIDFKDVLAFLERKGFISPTDYITGFELGAEVIGGTGSLTINSLGYQFGRHTITNGADSISGTASRDNLRGQGGNDTMRGNGADDWIWGGTGNDRILGDTGLDSLWGEAGNDILRGGGDGDTLSGMDGTDWLFGDAGNDQLYGGAGNDILSGGSGADRMGGGAGTDGVSYATSRTGVSVNLLLGTGTRGDAQGDRFTGIETVAGSNSGDVLVGSNISNILNGGAGNDVLAGAGGNDVLWGASGRDMFVFDAWDGRDVIRDFAPGADMLRFSGAASFAQLSVSSFGGDALIRFGQTAVILDGIAASAVEASWFAFG